MFGQPHIHPGDILREEFLVRLDLGVEDLARALRLPDHLLAKVINGEAGITADLALRLSRYFGTTERFWLEAQMRYDLDHARLFASAIADQITPHASAA